MVGRCDLIAAVGGLDCDDFRAGHNRCRRCLGIAIEIIGEGAGGHEVFRIDARVRQAGQGALRSRGQQVQRLPSLRTPAFANAPALEHHVLDAAHGKRVTRRKTGLTGADDDRVSSQHGLIFRLRARPGW